MSKLHSSIAGFRALLSPLMLSPLLLMPTLATAGALEDVVSEFLGGAVHAGLPSSFPRATVPAGLGLQVVGTLDAGSIVQVLVDAPDTSAASAALRAAYVAAGWTDLSTHPIVVRLCHEQHGSLQITPATRTSGHLRVMHSKENLFALDPGSPSCAQQPAPATQHWYSWIMNLVPVLQVPPQTKPATASVSQSSTVPGIVMARSSGNGVLELTINVAQENVIAVPDINVAGLDAHFGARLGEQGWQRDSGGSGQMSATSVWYKSATVTPSDAETQDVVLAGTLTLRHLQGDEFHIRFDLQGTVETAYTGGSLTYVRDIIVSDCAPRNDPAIGIRGIPAGSTGSRICRL